MATLVDLSGLDPRDLRETLPEEGCVIPQFMDGTGERWLVVKMERLPGRHPGDPTIRRTTFDRPRWVRGMFRGTTLEWSFPVVNWSKAVVDRYLGRSVPAPASITSTTSGRKVPDWPLTCPKCGRSDSAVLLLNFYDCKHGCYGRKAPEPVRESWDFTWRGQRWRATLVTEVPASHRGWWVGDSEDVAEFKDNPDLWAMHEWPKSWAFSSPGWVRSYDTTQEGEDDLLVELTEVNP